MSDGRRRIRGQVIPLATAVTDATYCFCKWNGEASTRGGAQLLCAGRETCLPDYHVARSDFACLIVEFVFSGKGRINYRGESHELSSGHIFCYGMDAPHDLWSDTSDPMTKYFAAYQWSGSSGTGQESEHSYGLLPGEIRWTRHTNVLKILFDELIREGRQSGPMHEEITARYLELILMKGAEALVPEAVRSSAGTESFDLVLEIIETSYAEIVSLEDLGRLCNLDPNYICRLFRKFGKETPIQCLTRHKLNRAAELLLSGSSPINEVSRDVGYEDPFYFSRVFKKRFGCSPKDFRESPPNFQSRAEST